MNPSEKAKREHLEKFIRTSAGVTTKTLEEEHQWQSVTGHCLIEAARMCVFADMLEFGEKLKKDAVLAALLHDGHKKEEIEAIHAALKNGESGLDASNSVTKKYLEELRSKKVPERTIYFIGMVGGMPEALIEIKKILDAERRNDEAVAALAGHYVDDYTRGDEWALPAERRGEHMINDVDRRVEKNQNNPNYDKIDAEAKEMLRANPFFSGKTSFEAMAVVSHKIEKTFAHLLGARDGTRIDPLDIPEIIDQKIKSVA